VKRIFSLALVFIITLVCSFAALADPITDAQKKQESINKELNSVQSSKKQAQEEKNRLQKDINNIKSQLELQNKTYEQLQEELRLLNEELEQYTAAVEEAERKYSDQKDTLKTRLRVMYENSQSSSMVNFLIQSKNIIDFFERLELVSMISERDSQLVEELKIAKLDVEYKRQLKEEETGNARNKVAEAKNRLEELSVSRAALEGEYNRSLQKLRELEKKEDQLLKESENIAKEIQRLQSSGSYAGGSMVWPYPGNKSIGSYFGMRYHPILKVNRMHNGLDIGGRQGDTIVAANKGTVIVAGWSSGGYGNYVIIDHGGGISTLYGHASQLLVKVGDKVEAGQAIAKVGSTGLSTGPHLHFEVRKNGTPVNPLDYVKP